MAVQQNKKSTNKRGNHRAHDFLTRLWLSNRQPAKFTVVITFLPPVFTVVRKSSLLRLTTRNKSSLTWIALI
jgi:hypothetical protein